MTEFDPKFVIRGNFAPRYFDHLFLRITDRQWHTLDEACALFESNNAHSKERDPISYNIQLWNLLGLVDFDKINDLSRNQRSFRISEFGMEMHIFYSTNRILFYDILHFLMYTAWPRSHDMNRALFWMYQATCDNLWHTSPEEINAVALTNKLLGQFYENSFFYSFFFAISKRSIAGLLLWMKKLHPPFVLKKSTSFLFSSDLRETCTPQLFHLALDYIYHHIEKIEYSSSFGIGEHQISQICQITLITPAVFWEMVSLTQLSIPGIEVQQGQFGTSIILSGPVSWIALPDFSPPERIGTMEIDE